MSLRFSSRGWALALALACGGASAAPAPALKAGEFTPPRAAPEFSLQGSDGARLNLQRFRGKIVLMAFGFTHCAEVCPVTLATLASARRKLGAAAGEVQVVYVTVDPARDDAKRMKTYLATFDKTFVGGTGSETALAAMRKDYGVSARKVPMADGYAVDHSSSVHFIDRQGKLVAMMPYGRRDDDYVHDLKRLLAR